MAKGFFSARLSRALRTPVRNSSGTGPCVGEGDRFCTAQPSVANIPSSTATSDDRRTVAGLACGTEPILRNIGSGQRGFFLHGFAER
jgi:hypothetical protein